MQSTSMMQLTEHFHTNPMHVGVHNTTTKHTPTHQVLEGQPLPLSLYLLPTCCAESSCSATRSQHIQTHNISMPPPTQAVSTERHLNALQPPTQPRPPSPPPPPQRITAYLLSDEFLLCHLGDLWLC